MDYAKSGSGSLGKKAPKHREHNAPGGKKNPFGKRDDDKAALLAKMKAAAEARKKD